MKILKKICMVTMCMMVCMLMSACISQSTYININKNGGSIRMESSMEKSIYDSLAGSGGSMDIEEGVEMSTFTQNDIEYVKFTKTQEYASIEELENALLDEKTLSDDDSGEALFTAFDITLDNKNKTLTVTGTIAHLNDTAQLDNIYSSFMLYITTPGNIISYSYGEQAEKNSVKINLLHAYSTGISFEIKGKSEPGLDVVKMALIVVPIVALAGLGAFTYILVTVKRKQRAAQGTNENVATDATNDEYGYTPYPTQEADTTPIEEDVYVEPEGYLDDDGTMYYLDSEGNPYYIDDYGNPYYIDENGTPFYVDSEGNPFYVDADGRPFYIGEDGNAYYITEDGE